MTVLYQAASLFPLASNSPHGALLLTSYLEGQQNYRPPPWAGYRLLLASYLEGQQNLRSTGVHAVSLLLTSYLDGRQNTTQAQGEPMALLLASHLVGQQNIMNSLPLAPRHTSVLKGPQKGSYRSAVSKAHCQPRF